MAPLSRREALRAAAAGVVPFAGCGGRDDPTEDAATDTGFGSSSVSSTPTRTRTLTATRDPTPTPGRTLAVGDTFVAPAGPSVTVRDVRVETFVGSLFTAGSGSHVDVACPDGRQFVVVDVAATGSEGRSILRYVPLVVDVDGTWYPRAGGSRYDVVPLSFEPRTDPAVGVPVPVTDASEAFVVWVRSGEPSVRWRIPSETVALVGRSPSFEVRSFDVPDRIRPYRPFEPSFTVANTGDRDGRFVAEFGHGFLPDYPEVAVEIPAGAERTRAEPMTFEPEDPTRDAGEVKVTLDWGSERLTRTATVADGSG